MPGKYINIISYFSIQREHFEKTILIRNPIKIFTKTHHIVHFFKNFSQGSMPPSICAADIIISIGKEPFFHSECNHNIH